MTILLSHPYIDWILTVIAAVVFVWLQANDLSQALVAFIIVFCLLILISIPLHVLTDTPTNTNYYLGLSKRP